MKHIIEFADGNSDVKQYLPEYQYDKNQNREWYWNIGKLLLALHYIIYSQYSVKWQVQRVYIKGREGKGEVRDK